MGTNYYARRTVPTYVGPYEEELHIGKSSGGWCFCLHDIREDRIDGLDTLMWWRLQLTLYDWDIYDEYGQQHSLEYLLDIITNRSRNEPVRQSFESGKAYGLYPEHYTYQQFLVDNHAEEGPNNLLRHKVDGVHCIAHGSGTWDCIVGEFS